MTPRTAKALDFIRERIERGGYAPTLDEIGAHLGVSRSNAHKVVATLVADGRLNKAANRVRGIALADAIDLTRASSDALRAELARRGMTLEALDRGERPSIRSGAVTCAADSCRVEVERGRLFCRKHWYALDRDLREGIVRAHAAGRTRRFQELVTEARDRIDSLSYQRVVERVW